MGSGWGLNMFIRIVLEEVGFELTPTSFLSVLKPLLYTGRVDSNRIARQFPDPSSVQQAPPTSPLAGWEPKDVQLTPLSV